jgi:ABC-2 type transport system ATP-binding protein
VTATTDPSVSASPPGAPPLATAGGPSVSGAIGEAVIDVRDLRKRYGDVDAVDGVTFDVRKGEVFGLLGPNGAGKTTTVEILEGLRTPDAGDVRVLGLDVAKDAGALKERIGLALQTAALYPKLTVGELLDLFASFYKRTRPVSELLELLDLTEKRNAQTKVLSGGQRQRLSVALALINEPELVFLDEPTTGLDPAARRALWDIIEAQKRDGRTVLLTTHYLEEAEILCDRVAIMDHGRILEMGTVDEVVARRFSERAVRFDAIAGLDDDRLAGIPGVVRVSHDEAAVLLYTTDVPATIGGLLAVTDSLGVEPANLNVRRPTLEDVFLALTGRALRD